MFNLFLIYFLIFLLNNYVLSEKRLEIPEEELTAVSKHFI